jgi:TonB family protein
MNTRLIGTMIAFSLALLSAEAQADGAAAPAVDTRDCGAPAYQRDWESNEESGQVLLAFQVGGNGKVKAVKLVESSGWPNLDSASVRAIKRCVFKSAASNSQNWESVRYTWVLK